MTPIVTAKRKPVLKPDMTPEERFEHLKLRALTSVRFRSTAPVSRLTQTVIKTHTSKQSSILGTTQGDYMNSIARFGEQTVAKSELGRASNYIKNLFNYKRDTIMSKQSESPAPTVQSKTRGSTVWEPSLRGSGMPERFMITIEHEPRKHAQTAHASHLQQQKRLSINELRISSKFDEGSRMTEEDFYMSIKGAASSLKKLDRTKLLELKHLTKQGHTRALHSLLQLAFKLQHDNNRANYEFRSHQIITGLSLYSFLAQFEPEHLCLQTACGNLQSLHRD